MPAVVGSQYTAGKARVAGAILKGQGTLRSTLGLSNGAGNELLAGEHAASVRRMLWINLFRSIRGPIQISSLNPC